MNHKNYHGKLSTICLLLGSMLMLFFGSGCTTATDPEYTQKFTSARTNCTGNEIVGIWVSKVHYFGTLSMRVTLLLRPDGTGLETAKAPLGNHFEYSIKWHYAGGGLWEGVAKGSEIAGNFLGASAGDCNFNLRFDGSKLYYKSSPAGGGLVGATVISNASFVFVRADDEGAVNEHLSKR